MREIICRPAHCCYCEQDKSIVGKGAALWGSNSNELKIGIVTDKPLAGITPHIFSLSKINHNENTVDIAYICSICGYELKKHNTYIEANPIENKIKYMKTGIHNWNALVLYKDYDYVIVKELRGT